MSDSDGDGDETHHATMLSYKVNYDGQTYTFELPRDDASLLVLRMQLWTQLGVPMDNQLINDLNELPDNTPLEFLLDGEGKLEITLSTVRPMGNSSNNSASGSSTTTSTSTTTTTSNNPAAASTPGSHFNDAGHGFFVPPAAASPSVYVPLDQTDDTIHLDQSSDEDNDDDDGSDSDVEIVNPFSGNPARAPRRRANPVRQARPQNPLVSPPVDFFEQARARMEAAAAAAGLPALGGHSGLGLDANVAQGSVPPDVMDVFRRMQPGGQMFAATFVSLYGDLDAHVMDCSLDQALDQAEREFRPLLIYLHNEQHENTPLFCYSLASGVSQVIGSNFLFWVAVLDDATTDLLSRLDLVDFPILAIVRKTRMQTSLVDLIQGQMDQNDLIGRLLQVVERTQPALDRAREEAERQAQEREQQLASQRQAADAARQIREEQDSQYEASLQADRQRAEARRAAEAEAAEIERRQNQATDNAKKWLHERAARRAELEASLPAEAARSDANVVRLGMRLPDGTRAQRFFATTELADNLFIFIESLDAQPEQESEESLVRQVLENNGETPPVAFQYAVIASHQGVNVEQSAAIGKTLDEVGINFSAMLNVRRLD